MAFKKREKELDLEAEAIVDDAVHNQEAAMIDDEFTETGEDAPLQASLEIQEALKEHEQKFLRLSADFANYKRRVEKEKSDIYRSANERLMVSLLSVIDNMERALSHAEESSKESFVSGVEMVFKNMMEVVAKEGLKDIEAMDQPFDPNQHHAVMTEAKEGYDSDYVIAVLQKGYLLNDKVIRHAMVKVSE